MTQIHKTIFITAPKEKVWDIMLAEQTYKEWAGEFHPGSYYKGEWKEGAEIDFIGPNNDGMEYGMRSLIKTLRPYEVVEMETLGSLVNDKLDTEDTKWVGIPENYYFVEKDGGTELEVKTAMPEDVYEDMNMAWDKALAKLKEIVEK